MKKIARTKQFETFWQIYPPRWSERQSLWRKSDKEGAWREWRKMTDTDRKLAIKAAPTVERSKFTPDARKWLYHKQWEDEIVQVIKQKPEPKTPEKPIIPATPEQKAEIKRKAGRIFKTDYSPLGQKQFNSRRNKARKDLRVK